MHSLIGTAKLNGLDPEAYLREAAKSSSASPSTRSTASTGCSRVPVGARRGTASRAPTRSLITALSSRRCSAAQRWRPGLLTRNRRYTILARREEPL